SRASLWKRLRWSREMLFDAVGISLNQVIRPTVQQEMNNQASPAVFLSLFALPSKFGRIIWSTFLSFRE
ncbi:unnamed protein product, partial [Amoebophrya sp. A25]